jgi:hypothetical protein
LKGEEAEENRRVREAFRALDGKRRRFQATFERFGEKTFKNHVSKTLLFLNVTETMTGQVLTDHLWFPMNKTFEKLELKQGETVIFDARVGIYHKKQRFNDGLRGDYSIVEDYKLRNPTNCVVKGRQIAQAKTNLLQYMVKEA